MKKRLELGEQQGCYSKDKIWINFTPSELQDLMIILKKEALEETDYYCQGIDRELKDKFQDNYDYWRRERDKKDNR